MRRSIMIWENFTIRVDIIGQHQLLLVLSHVLIIHYLSCIAGTTERPRVLLYLKLDLVLATLILLILYIELPNRILSTGMASGLVLRRGHLSWLQIIFAVLWSAVLVGELDHSVSIRSWRNGQIGTIVVGARRLINLLRRIDIPRKLAAKLLPRRLLTTLLLLIIQLLIAHRIIGRTYSFLDYHSGRVAASIALLSERGGVHMATGSSRINWMLFDYLVYAVVAASLDHGAVLRTHVLSCSKLLDSSKIWVLWRDQLGLHCVGHWLVALVPYGRRILYTVWHDGSNAVWIHASLRSHEIHDAG